MPSFDDIILGGGASGLSLAYHMTQAGLDRRILLIERAPKEGHDRTWCFWEKGDGPFEGAVHRRWEHLWLHGPGGSQKLDIAPYTYKMIRSGDFYNLMDDWLGESSPTSPGSTAPSPGWRSAGTACGCGLTGRLLKERGPITAFTNRRWRGGARAACSSTSAVGWSRRTLPTFDPNSATLMDFRVAQHGEVRFVYVLPLDARRALVEYTLFSPQLLSSEAYDAGLRGYLGEVLKLG